MGPAHQLNGWGGTRILAPCPYFLFPEHGGHVPDPSASAFRGFSQWLLW